MHARQNQKSIDNVYKRRYAHRQDTSTSPSTSRSVSRPDGPSRPLCGTLPLPIGLSPANSRPRELYNRHTAKLIPDDRVSDGAHHHYHVVLRIPLAPSLHSVTGTQLGSSHPRMARLTLLIAVVTWRYGASRPRTSDKCFCLKNLCRSAIGHIHAASITRRQIGANRDPL
jgi:hypothetical protein